VSRTAAPNAGTALTARGLRRVYRVARGTPPVEAIRGVDLEVGRGEFLTLTGPSGSGKSTLLNLLGCIDTPSGGEIEVLGQPVAAESKARLAQFRLRHVGLVFQRFNLLEYLTARENVALPLHYLRPRPRGPETADRVDEMLRRVGLGERMHHRPDQLSGGEQQRVGVARALVNRPDILIADEPTGELDSATGLAIIELMEEARREYGTTLVIVTHDPAISDRADRTVLMADGVIVDD